MNLEEFDEEDLIISRMIEPVILCSGRVIKNGMVMLSRTADEIYSAGSGNDTGRMQCRDPQSTFRLPSSRDSQRLGNSHSHHGSRSI